MSSTLNTFLFGLYPYIALAICLAVSWVRFDRDQYSWKADSSQILGNKGMRLGQQSVSYWGDLYPGRPFYWPANP